jgi:hypothetical protein
MRSLVSYEEFCSFWTQSTERQIRRAGQISCVLQQASCAAVASQQQPSRTRRKMAGIAKAFSSWTAIAYRIRPRTGLERESASLYSVLLEQRFIPFVRKTSLIVHHSENSAQMSFSSAQTKFLNPCHTHAFLTHANEHYAANLRGVNTHLCAKVTRIIKTRGNSPSCPITIISMHKRN